MLLFCRLFGNGLKGMRNEWIRNKTDFMNVPLMEVKLMRSTGKQDISGEVVYEGDFTGVR